MPMRAVAVPAVPTVVEPLAGVASSQSPPDTVLASTRKLTAAGLLICTDWVKARPPHLVIESRRCGARRQLPEVQSHDDFLLYAGDRDGHFADVRSGCQIWSAVTVKAAGKLLPLAGLIDSHGALVAAEARKATCVPAGALVDGTNVPDTAALLPAWAVKASEDGVSCSVYCASAGKAPASSIKTIAIVDEFRWILFTKPPKLRTTGTNCGANLSVFVWYVRARLDNPLIVLSARGIKEIRMGLGAG